MTIASQAKRDKKAKELEGHLKKLDDPVRGIPNRKKLIGMVHSAIRQSWMISPVKLAYYEMGRVPDEDPSTRREWKMQCECCGEWYKTSEIEIDHINGHHSFTTVEEFGSYFDAILDVEFKDLQRICKFKCHPIKTHMEKNKFPDMNTSCVDKIGIFLTNSFDTKGLTKVLTGLKISPESNAPKRKEQIREWVRSLDLSYEESSAFLEKCTQIVAAGKKRRYTSADLKLKVAWENFWNKNAGFIPKTTLKLLNS